MNVATLSYVLCPSGLMGEIMHKVHKTKMLHLVIVIKTLKEQNVSYISCNRRL